MSLPRLSWPRACLIAIAFAGGTVQAQTAAPLPPPEHFFENAVFGGAKLSPNGRLLAVRMGQSGKRESLAVIDMDGDKAKQIVAFADVDVGRFEWVNDKRLVFDTADKQLGIGDLRHAPGLYAINADGSDMVQLAMRRGVPFVTDLTRRTRKIQPWNTFMLSQPGKQEGDSIYVQSPAVNAGGMFGQVDLLRLDTRSARAENVLRPKDARNWLLDQQGEPRLVMSVDDDVATMHVRDEGSKDWRKLTSFPAYSRGGFPFTPIGFAADGRLFVRAPAGRDTSAVYTYDLQKAELGKEPLVITTGYDFRGSLVNGQGKLLGIRFKTDAEMTHWFDPKMQAVQQAVDAALPGLANLVSVAPRAETPWMLVESYSDAQPRQFRLYNADTGKFKALGVAHPQILPAQMGRQDMVRYMARDGLEIPALLTLPPGGKRTGLPLVVMVHGGPFTRGTAWGWKAETQFLASRGYAVLEPEFRGSTGYGFKHFRAGWKQWGLAMQDDIADGAKWAIAEGVADPKRICIAGAGYGGYAAMMGLVQHAELFKCGVNRGGMTSIPLLFDTQWGYDDDVADDVKKYGMPVLIGDPVKDAGQFAATSPLMQAGRITQPVLLAYGGADRRVPINHGKKFHDVVRKTNKDVEWVEYESEGQGFAVPKNRIDYWTRVEKFLDRNIGKP